MPKAKRKAGLAQVKGKRLIDVDGTYAPDAPVPSPVKKVSGVKGPDVEVTIKFPTWLQPAFGDEPEKVMVWDQGTLHLKKNAARGIEAKQEEFYEVKNLTAQLRRLLRRAKIVLRRNVTQTYGGQKHDLAKTIQAIEKQLGGKW